MLRRTWIQAFYVVGDDNTFPLWTAAPRYAGGLDFSTSATGAALAMMGATVVFSQLAVRSPQLLNGGPHSFS